MSGKALSVEKIAARTFAYRNIKKDFTEFKACENVTKNAHLELGEHYETKIVEDRPDDWFEFQQLGLESVGVKNIIAMLAKRGENPYDGRFAFKDEEAIDISMIDPMDPESVKRMATGAAAASEKLEALAKSVGLTAEELVDHMIKGDLATFIESKKVTETAKEKEGE
jgi:hypothetical protein